DLNKRISRTCREVAQLTVTRAGATAQSDLWPSRLRCFSRDRCAVGSSVSKKFGISRSRAGPQSGPQLERHRAAQQVLRRADFDLDSPNLNVAALTWQARG